MAFSCIKAITDFKEWFQKKEDCDVILKVKGHDFPAHKTILRARSVVFDSIFRNDTKDKEVSILNIEDCDPSSFSDFLCFLYCGILDNLTTENVFGLFHTAYKYDVQDLRLWCLKFIKKNLSLKSFYNTVTLALQHCDEQLLQLSINFLAKNLQQVTMTDEWQSFLSENQMQCNRLVIRALKLNKN